MNKFFAFALFACVAASAALADDETKEVGLLIGHQKLFSDFCLSQRDAIRSDIIAQANSKTSEVFRIFFNAATEISGEVLSVQTEAVKEFAQSIRNPDQSVADGPLSEEEVESLIEQGKREIQAQTNVASRLMTAAKSLVGTVFYNTANSAIFVRLAKARSFLNADTLLQGLSETCGMVAQYERQLISGLEAEKEELLKAHTKPAVQQMIKDMSVPSLQCYTTKYIARLEAFCSILRNGSSAFMKMLGIKSNFALPPVKQ